MRLVERLLGEEERLVQFSFQRLPEGRVLGAKLGAEIRTILRGHAIQNENWVQCHEILSFAPGTASDKRLWISGFRNRHREHTSAARDYHLNLEVYSVNQPVERIRR